MYRYAKDEGHQIGLLGLKYDNPHPSKSGASREFARVYVSGFEIFQGRVQKVVQDEALREARLDGWMKALEGAEPSNPFEIDTQSYTEWNIGWMQGYSLIEEEEPAVQLPVMDVQVVPERSFLAVLNNLAIDLVLSKRELAERFDLNQEMLEERMVVYGLYDEDAIPMHERVVA